MHIGMRSFVILLLLACAILLCATAALDPPSNDNEKDEVKNADLPVGADVRHVYLDEPVAGTATRLSLTISPMSLVIPAGGYINLFLPPNWTSRAAVPVTCAYALDDDDPEHAKPAFTEYIPGVDGAHNGARGTEREAQAETAGVSANTGVAAGDAEAVRGESMAELRLTLREPLLPKPGSTLYVFCSNVPLPPRAASASNTAAVVLSEKPHAADALPPEDRLVEEVLLPRIYGAEEPRNEGIIGVRVEGAVRNPEQFARGLTQLLWLHSHGMVQRRHLHLRQVIYVRTPCDVAAEAHSPEAADAIPSLAAALERGAGLSASTPDLPLHRPFPCDTTAARGTGTGATVTARRRPARGPIIATIFLFHSPRLESDYKILLIDDNARSGRRGRSLKHTLLDASHAGTLLSDIRQLQRATVDREAEDEEPTHKLLAARVKHGEKAVVVEGEGVRVMLARAVVPAHCFNGVQDVGETDVDCGYVCGGCRALQHCVQDNDCRSGRCDENQCVSVATGPAWPPEWNARCVA